MLTDCSINIEITGIETLRQRVYNECVRRWKEAVTAFLDASTQAVHVDTGMTIGSYAALAAKVRQRTALGLYKSPGMSKPGWVSIPSGFPTHLKNNIAQHKSFSLGVRLGKAAFDSGLSKLDYGSMSNPRLDFEYTISVAQHYLHEDSSHHKESQNWQSLVAGEMAFSNYIEGNKTIVINDGIDMDIKAPF